MASPAIRRGGHDVYFIEDRDDYPSCYDPARGTVDANPSYGLRFAARAFERLGLERHCRAARALAKLLFDARKVLTNLIERALSIQ